MVCNQENTMLLNNKIAFLLPYYEGRNHSQFLGVGYLSQSLIDNGYDTLIIDEDAVWTLMDERGAKNQLEAARNFVLNKLNEYSPQIICLTINTPNYERSLELLSLTRRIFPETIIIVGGPHITTSWMTFKKYHSLLFDIAIIGEGEQTIVEVCNRISSSSSLEGIKGTIFSQSNGSSFVPRELIGDLDQLPYPDRKGFYKAFNKDEYSIIDKHYMYVFYSHLPGFKGKKIARIVASRGCDFTCSFCSPSFFWRDPYSNKVVRRLRNPSRIADEIEYLSKLGYEAFYFDDPTFPFKSKPEFYLSFIKELNRRELKINWAAPTRSDELTKPILEQIFDSGFSYTYFGLETYTKNNLEKMGKFISIDYCLQLLEWCQDIGIHCDVSYQIGICGEDLDSIIKSIQWLEKHNLQKRSFFSIAAIWPETPLAVKHGIKSGDYEPSRDKKELEERGLYYFNPGNPGIERYFSNCSGTFHFINEDIVIQAKYYLIDTGFIKRFEN